MRLCPKKRFWKLYFITFALVMLLLLIGLGIFSLFMFSFEQAQPDSYAASCVGKLTEDVLCDLLEKSLPNTGSPYETSDSIRMTFLSALSSLKGDITVRKCFPAYAADRPVFTLIKDRAAIAEIVLVPDHNGAFGLKRWKLESIEILYEDWAPAAADYKFYVPKGAGLTVNGVPVPDDAIVETDVAYGLASVYERDGCALWDVCCVPDLFSKPSVNCTLDGEVCRWTEEGFSVYFHYPDTASQTYTVTAPSDASVLINGVAADSKHITESDIPYAYAFIESGRDGLPTAVTYTLDNLLAAPDVEVVLRGQALHVDNENGNYTAVYPEEQLYNCTLRVPQGSSVTFHGADCSAYFTGTVPVFPELSQLPVKMPSYDVYTFSGLYASPEGSFTVEGEGNTLTFDALINGYNLQLTAMPPQEANLSLETLASDFLRDYITYTSKGYLEIDTNLEKALSYVVKNSETYKRIQNSQIAIRYVTPVSRTVYNRREIVSSIRYSEDLWEYAVEFDIDQYTSGYLREYVGTFYLVFARINGQWMIADMRMVSK